MKTLKQMLDEWENADSISQKRELKSQIENICEKVLIKECEIYEKYAGYLNPGCIRLDFGTHDGKSGKLESWNGKEICICYSYRDVYEGSIFVTPEEIELFSPKKFEEKLFLLAEKTTEQNIRNAKQNVTNLELSLQKLYSLNPSNNLA